MMASKGWKVVQPHVPLIRFRKGGLNRGASAAPSATSGTASSRGATGPQVISLPTIDDIHLPARFQRRPISDKEIEYINRGGPE
ncbi:28S ribosomal protein S36, mitochondrial isoform X2 [Polistes fuscatus]|uniref:28S ribosomal protein S36, mitochondrial isoform X2 n=1 Tax=Polistes fuscatus TaxID=30207 RepID=UPI001CA7F42F|nr:28S ribosomal protein S36, mitochondrial isoform X2 [Polistes fuscatus]